MITRETVLLITFVPQMIQKRLVFTMLIITDVMKIIVIQPVTVAAAVVPHIVPVLVHMVALLRVVVEECVIIHPRLPASSPAPQASPHRTIPPIPSLPPPTPTARRFGKAPPATNLGLIFARLQAIVQAPPSSLLQALTG